MTLAPMSLCRPLLLAGGAPLLALLLTPLAAFAAPGNPDDAVRLAVVQMQDLGAMLRPQERRSGDRRLAALSPTPHRTAVPALPALPAPAMPVVAAPAAEPAAAAAPAAAVAVAAAPLVAEPVAPVPAVAVSVAAAPAPAAPVAAVPVVATPVAAAPAAAETVAIALAPVAAAPAAVMPIAAAPVAIALVAQAPVAAAPVAALALPQMLAASVPAVVAPPPLLLAAAPARLPMPVAAAEPRFDLSVNNAPAAQVFLQLVNGTAYNMLVSPDVSGMLSITLKDTTVSEAMDTLRELFGYEYRITGNRIFVYPNTVQTRLYKVNYLPGRRQGASDTRVTSSAITLGGSGANPGGVNSGGGGNNTSGNRSDDSAHVRTTSDADFWREVQNSLVSLVGSQSGRSVVLNPAAGVVVVKATPAELRQVENYLKAVQLSIERQVMLEAKIVEVQLNHDAQTGINWAGFGKLGSGKLSIGSAAPGTTLGSSGNLSNADGTSIAPGVNLAAGALGRGFYGLAFQAANFAALLNFLQTQGDVQVLSSPRIATLNNQKAVLKVGSDELYVTGVTTTTNSSGSGSVTSPSLTLQPFFSGISLDVTPQIDDAGNVMLHVHPTISVVTEKQKNIDLGSLGSFRLPLASSTVNETDSIVRVKDGQIVAIGGLMKHTMVDERTGLPVLGDAPVVGGLFRQTSTIHSKRELVIMLKPTIIQEDGVWPDAPQFLTPGALSKR